MKEEAKQDDVSLLGGGVAFFALLAFVPALVAIVSIYGLFASESTVVRQVGDVLGAAPREVRELVSSQLRSIATGSSGGVGIAALVGIVIALWSASSDMKHLIGAINLAYDEGETRGFLRVRAISLAMTIGAILFLVVSFAAIAVLPAVMLWRYLTALVIILGAELNAELERQTRRDTTKGPDAPLGRRGAYAADTVGGTAEEVRSHPRGDRSNVSEPSPS